MICPKNTKNSEKTNGLKKKINIFLIQSQNYILKFSNNIMKKHKTNQIECNKPK
jgi:hypothetical protein